MSDFETMPIDQFVAMWVCKAVEAEREACAKVADDYATANASYLVSRSVASAIASAIRARTGET